MTIRLLALLSVFSVLLFSPFAVKPVDADSVGSTPKLAVLPPELMGPKEMGYLVEGVRSMLSSRLARGAKVELVERGAVDRAVSGLEGAVDSDTLPGLAKSLGADFLLAGSLTAIGGGVSLDLTLHDMKTGEAPRSFFAGAEQESAIIPAIDRVVAEIGAELRGDEPPVATAAPRRASAEQPSYVSEHPARQFYGGWSTSASPFIRQSDFSWLRGYSRSQDILLGLHAMEVADITGDGELEFIVAGANRIEVYAREMGRFVRIAQENTLNRYPIHYLSAADLLNRGKAQIFVSAADHQRAYSLVLEWDGERLVRTHEGLPWYIRAMELPHEGKALVAQRLGVGHGAYMLPGLYRLNLSSDSVTEGNRLSVPGRLNLFDITFADLDGDGAYEILVINQNDRLEVLNAAGGLLWRSPDYFGGTTRYLGGRDMLSGGDTSSPGQQERYYVPSRVVLRDLTGNSLPDVVLVRNIPSLTRVLGRLKSYKGGEVHALSWDGTGMSEIWRTRRIDAGYIADLQLGDELVYQPEDGSEELKGTELFVGVVLRSDGLGILSSSESSIFVYPVEYEK